MLNHYEENLCKLTNDEEEEFQKNLKNTLKQIKDFDSFFMFVGLKKRSHQEINEMLKNSIKNSERKKYHGDFEDRHSLPETGIQLKKLLSKYKPIDKIFTITSDKGDKEVKVTIK